MNVIVGVDGSKYGRWALNWVAKLPFVEPPWVTVLHVLDLRALRAPFLSRTGSEQYRRKEIQRMEARSARTLKEAKQQLAELKLKGTVRKEQGARGGRADALETRAETRRAPGGGQSRPRRHRPLHAR